MLYIVELVAIRQEGWLRIYKDFLVRISKIVSSCNISYIVQGLPVYTFCHCRLYFSGGISLHIFPIAALQLHFAIQHYIYVCTWFFITRDKYKCIMTCLYFSGGMWSSSLSLHVLTLLALQCHLPIPHHLQVRTWLLDNKGCIWVHYDMRCRCYLATETSSGFRLPE